MKHLPQLLTALTLGATALHAQIAASGTYTQNFDSLESTNTNHEWRNNSTLPGWYGAYDFQEPVVHYSGRSGLSGGIQPKSYGTDSERSFGVSGAFGSTTVLGVRFTNTGVEPILGMRVSFDGEQWGRRHYTSTPAPDTLYFSYKIYTSSPGDTGLLNDTDWVNVPALDFTSPNWTDPAEASLDGNAPENRVEDLSAWIAGISLLPGQEIWLRWVAYGEATGNHDLAIDNLSVSFFTTAIPEPASTAALLGLTSLAFASRRRPRAAG